MEIRHEDCAGLDVHKRSVVACVLAGREKQTRSFGTTTPELLQLRDWLAGFGVTHVAMESTGSYWKPVYNLLEGGFELLVANSAHMKAVPGHKTDVADAEWIADLLRHGLLRASFIPDPGQRELRELTRHRSSLVEKRTQAVNELQKALESSNLKLQSVVSDITGVSATAMLRELLEQERPDPAALAQLAKRRLRAKIPELEKALAGNVRPHHKVILRQLLADIELFETQIAELDLLILQRVRDQQGDIDRLDDIPGINQRVGEIIVAEIGTRMERFPSAAHLASWVGLCPGNHESAGKRQSGRTRHGNRALRCAMIEAAHGAARTKKSSFCGLYRRLSARRGKKKALIAVAHRLLNLIYLLLKTGQPYRELGVNYYDKLNPLRVIQRLTKRIQNLGFVVSLEPAPIPA
jgi:transposase